ncbi:MAG: hypothetical protein KF724_09520 [Phycisphaeraceae bacterium]|nr:hypothetical protein [Phycisphaeraceae bacterium]
MKKLAGIVVAGLFSSIVAADINPNWTIARVWDEETLAAIRLSTPRPPVHARNLYHMSSAVYDGWATYDPVARGRFFFEKHTAKDIEAARHETISFAAYRILKNRFVAGNGPNIVQINANIDATFAALGYDKNFTSTVGNSPAEIGNRIASIIIAQGNVDGSNQAGNYAPNNGYTPQNPPMPFKVPGTNMFQPNRWQPLAFDFLILQNGEIVGASIQGVLCPHWGPVTSFALTTFDRDPVTGIYFSAVDGSGPPVHGSLQMKLDAVDVIQKSSLMDPTDSPLIDISPAVWHNCPLGSYVMNGYGLNPVTNEPYAPNIVKLADYARVVAEYWADGPTSETPPGHWHKLANEVSDVMAAQNIPFQIGGVGPVLDRLEWDAKLYITLGGANHDAAIAAWGRKGYYDSARPISLIRWMAQLGQSSDPGAPNYHPSGLPLIPGLIEQVTEEDVLPGGRFADFPHLVYEPLSGEPIGMNSHVGSLAIRTWLGGFYGGVTGVANFGALPGHVYRTGSGWHVGGWHVGTNDSPGVLNPGIRARTPMITEIRLSQVGDPVDQFIELSGPPGMSLNGLTYIVIGDEVQTKVPSPQGRIQNVVDLSGHQIGANGTFVIAKASYTLGKADAIMDQPIRKIGNSTHLLVSGFNGYLGQDLDFFDAGELDWEQWDSVIDSVGLRRTADQAGLYTTTVVGPDLATNQLYGVGWELADRWMPYQSSAFVTPPFPGYTSGHSTYSRAAAEAMVVFTGSQYFPNGLFSFTMPTGWSHFEISPSENITLQWVSYYDAADEAGISRIYGGIHPMADDLPGRVSGSSVGKRAAARALALFRGHWQSPDINLDGNVDGADLAIVLGNWGQPGLSDLNGDGTTDGADLAILLGLWGTQG